MMSTVGLEDFADSQVVASFLPTEESVCLGFWGVTIAAGVPSSPEGAFGRE